MTSPTIGLITPTIGTPFLRACVESVAAQTATNITHYVVVDGPAHEERVRDQLGDLLPLVTLIVLPSPTGQDGFRGHRIYGAMPFLMPSDFVGFLDEDNLLAPDHISSLVSLVHECELDWAYSLRNIVASNGDHLCEDNCMSLGIWGNWFGCEHMIDTSCYLLKRELAVESSWIWHRKGYDPTICDADKTLSRWLLDKKLRGFTTGKYTVNYRLGSTEQTAGAEYFAEGNRVMETMYKYFPWRTPILQEIVPERGYRRIVAEHESMREGILKYIGEQRAAKQQGK